MSDPGNTLVLFDMSTGNNFVGTKRSKQDNENIAQILIYKQFYSEHDIAYPNFDPEFDPSSQRALQEVLTTDPPVDGPISRIFRQGFRYKEKVFRPSEVEVKRYPS